MAPPAESAPGPVADQTATWPDNLRRAWKTMNAGGRYRLAAAEDFRFSEAAKRSMGNDRLRMYQSEPNGTLVGRIWGDRRRHHTE